MVAGGRALTTGVRADGLAALCPIAPLPRVCGTAAVRLRVRAVPDVAAFGFGLTLTLAFGRARPAGAGLVAFRTEVFTATERGLTAFFFSRRGTQEV
jgi:hypothetical protein